MDENENAEPEATPVDPFLKNALIIEEYLKRGNNILIQSILDLQNAVYALNAEMRDLKQRLGEGE